ncbi:MAG TPA: methyltransferase domain-containing protein [Polyangia bacterium]|jgi:SAM-dependent methyltransferase
MANEHDEAEARARFEQKNRAEWTDPRAVTAWRAWFPKIKVQGERVTRALIAAADLRPGLRVLDLASGPGEPALTIAAAVAPGGQVTATDLSPGMLESLADNRRRYGVTNVDIRQADAQELPFEDASFDRVTCRFGVMLFTDVGRALGEARRVLRPDGRATFVAWGPPAPGSFMGTMLEPFRRRNVLPQPPPGAPGPFRFAAAGSLSRELEQAGFSAVREEARLVAMPWPGDPRELWQHFYELAAPLRPFFDGMPRAEREAATAEVVRDLGAMHDGTSVNAAGAIVVATGVRGR